MFQFSKMAKFQLQFKFYASFFHFILVLVSVTVPVSSTTLIRLIQYNMTTVKWSTSSFLHNETSVSWLLVC